MTKAKLKIKKKGDIKVISGVKKKFRYSKPPKPQKAKPVFVTWDYTSLGRLFAKEIQV